MLLQIEELQETLAYLLKNFKPDYKIPVHQF